MISQQQEPIYERLVFIHTDTIGCTKSILAPVQYNWSADDILIPHIIDNHMLVFYLLFHTPAVYNWLRTIPCRQQSLLNQYILTHLSHNSSKPKFPSYVNINQLFDNLKIYCQQWQIAKLAYCSQIYVKQVISIDKVICKHVVKKVMNSLDVLYDYSLRKLCWKSVQCKQCGKVEVCNKIRNYPYTVLLKKFQGETLQLVKLENNNNIKFDISMTFFSQSICIKCANGLWYEVNLKTKITKTIKFDKIDWKKGLIFAYSQQYQSTKRFRQIALPIESSFKDTIQRQDKINTINQQIIHPLKPKSAPITNKKDSVKNVSLQSNNYQEELKELVAKNDEIIINTNNKSLNKEYIQTVSQLFNRPKVKDQYEHNYDMGKLKKIKEKKQYIIPNFNEVYLQVQKQNQLSTQNTQFDKKQRTKQAKEVPGQLSSNQTDEFKFRPIKKHKQRKIQNIQNKRKKQKINQ